MKTQVKKMDTMISEEDLNFRESYIEMKCIYYEYEANAHRMLWRKSRLLNRYRRDCSTMLVVPKMS